MGSLDLSMNGIADAGTAAVADSESSLESLYLLGCEIGPSGAKLLAQAKRLNKLQVLALSGNNLGDEGAIALAKSIALPSLTTLDLCANGISDTGALALAQSSHLKNLKVIELFGNEVGGRGRSALRKRFGAGLHLRCPHDSARRAASAWAKSAGGGTSNRNDSWLSGCTKPSTAACKA